LTLCCSKRKHGIVGGAVVDQNNLLGNVVDQPQFPQQIQNLMDRAGFVVDGNDDGELVQVYQNARVLDGKSAKVSRIGHCSGTRATE
jgi:hypothetical protein